MVAKRVEEKVLSDPPTDEEVTMVPDAVLGSCQLSKEETPIVLHWFAFSHLSLTKKYDTRGTNNGIHPVR